MHELLLQTIELKKQLALLQEYYENNQAPESRKDKQFFAYVRKQTDPIYELLARWEDLALATVKNRQVKVHPKQIVSTRENMELILMHSYYIDVKRRRYMQLHQACLYVFDLLADQLE
ncbi:DUF1798 family protein [Virgibacillus halophilus]|uniref:DUF1798 family protein n=1 Tax=Tigheibacillus halophilus TaxID=361280 RepID=UPI0036279970